MRMRYVAWLCLAAWLMVPAAVLVRADEPIDRRIAELEAETQRLRAELQQLQQRPTRLPEVNTYPTALTAPAAEEEVEYYTLDELKAEMKDLAWTKGDFKIVPYGFLWAWTVYETERTKTGDYSLYVISPDDHNGGEHNWDFDARGTRLGIDVTGPKLPAWFCATSGGKVEIDFQGDAVYENKAGVLLRHAYVEVKNDYYRLLFGQTWDVISPLYPGVLLYSVAWGTGNIGYRRAQLRAERYFHFSDTSLVTAQIALADSLWSDKSSTALPDHTDWPVIEGRLAWKLGRRGKGCKPWEIGVSSHIGNQIWDFTDGAPEYDKYLRTWSLNFDANIPLTDRLTVKGELFTGENLGTFLGGILQGVNTSTRDTIRSSGGWFDVGYDWTDRLHSHAGYVIDDPFNQDLSNGGRAYSQMYFFNVSYNVTKKFIVGIELSQWDTHYIGKRDGSSFRTELMAKYAF
ncbi:hypothetical protein [Thermostilla marina]